MTQRIDHLCVLMVDDQEAARTMARTMMKTIGISQVFEAASGREAFQLLDGAGDSVDLVLCDWNMPEMSGLELLHQVRAAGIQTPFLMVTGRADMVSVMEAKAAGVSSYIAKPFSPAQLEAKLRVASSKIVSGKSAA
jgi:CheY-like chemotaxis protein